MPKISKLEVVLPSIEQYFNELPKKVFTVSEFAEIFYANKEDWQLPASQRFEPFANFLLANSKLFQVELISERYTNLNRLVWEGSSIFALALSIKNKSYLTHGSAAFLHRLTDEIPKIVSVNYEQSPKPQSGALSQDGIHRAFARPQRQTNLVYKYEEHSIVVINGKNTGRCGVYNHTDNDGGNPVDITNLERTLIDITVRPAYAGGAFAVLEAYRQAKDRVNIESLLETLKTLNYIYPYHQAIGFFMDRAGYPKNQWMKFHKLGIKFEFYAAHELPENKKFDTKWKIYYPDGLE